MLAVQSEVSQEGLPKGYYDDRRGQDDHLLAACIRDSFIEKVEFKRTGENGRFGHRSGFRSKSLP